MVKKIQTMRDIKKGEYETSPFIRTAFSDKGCNCRNKNLCPIPGKCLSEGVVYQALVKREDGVTDSYVGLTENSFKDRWTKHKSSFRTRNPKNASGLSRYIWNLMDEKIDYEIEWKIVS